jgi:hypothetical protein
MEILAKLLGGQNRVKVLRVFLFNPTAIFEVKELASRMKMTVASVRKELRPLSAVGLINPKSELRLVGKKKKKVPGWQLNPNFAYNNELRSLLSLDLFPKRNDLLKRFNRCGRIKLMMVSGVFLQDTDREVDLVLVGDNLKKTIADSLVKSMEAEVGKELTYAILGTSDFVYRLHSSDKFVRDMFDFPHEVVVDKIGI